MYFHLTDPKDSLLESVFRAAPIGIGIVVNRNFTQVNDRFCVLVGYSREEMIGKNARMIYPTDEDYEYVGKEKYAQIQNEGIGTVETRFRKKDGQIIPVILSSSPLDLYDYSKGVAFTALDISKQKEADYSLKEEKALLNLITETSPVGIVLVDKEGRISFANKRAEQILGLTKDEIKQKYYNSPDWKITDLDGNDLPDNQLPFLVVQKQKKPIYDIQHAIEKPNGKKRFLSINAAPLWSEIGEFAGMVASIQNITKKRIIELSLKEEQDKLNFLSLAFDQSSEGVAMSDLEGKITYINQSFAHLHGYKPEDLIGKDISIFHNTNQILEVKAANKQILEKGEFIGEIWHKHANGRVFPTIMHNTLIKDKNGQSIALLGTMRDITEQKKIEQQLKSESERAESYLELVNVIIITLDREGNITLLNREGYNVLQYEPGTLIGKNWFENCVPLHDRVRVHEYFTGLMKGAMEIVPFYENPVLTKNNTERMIAWSSILLKDSNGIITGILSSGDDITERKEAEEKLIQSEREKSIILESISELMVFQDVKNNVIWANVAAAESVNQAPKDLIGKKCYEIWHDRNSTCENCPVILSFKTGNVEFNELETPDGRIWYIKGFPVKNENDDIIGAVEITTEITDLKRSQEQLQAAYNRVNLYKDIFTHDINNVLQNIKSSAELSSIYLESPEKVKNLKDLNEIIKEQVNRGKRLIDNVRKLSEIDETENPLKPINFETTLNEAIDFVVNGFRSKEIKIQKNLRHYGKELKANELLQDIFENLLINATRHNSNPKIELIINSTLQQKVDKDYLRIEFIDNGIGITDQRKKLIFKRDASERGLGKGLGLGLSLVKKIIQKYNGEIWVENRDENDYTRGSKFVLLIPIAN